MSRPGGRCYVEGCERDAAHARLFAITAEWLGIEETTVDAGFCCDHLDMLTNEEPPFLDLIVVGRVRG